MIRALLVDDEDIARERLRQLLGSIADLEVVGEAGHEVQLKFCGFHLVDRLPSLLCFG